MTQSPFMSHCSGRSRTGSDTRRLFRGSRPFKSGRITATMMAISGLACITAGEELVTNGGLENATITACTGNCANKGIPGWQTPEDCSIDWINKPAGCSGCGSAEEGDAFVDLCGSNANCGFIAQEISPQIGRRYRLSFLMGGNCGGNLQKVLTCKVGGQVLASITYQCPASGCTFWEDAPRVIEFVPTSSPVTLRFEGLSGNANYGPVLDAISVIPAAPICPGDLNDDGVVGPPDLGILLALWNTDGSPNGADINLDGTVNAADLGLLVGGWGVCE